MENYKKVMSDELVAALKAGGLAVIPTDTIYGIVGQADRSEVVERIYELKGRDADKPFIILISEVPQLTQFGIVVDDTLAAKLNSYWPGPVSVILPVTDEKLNYLHRGHDSLAFRLPADEQLRELISETGPLVAPSANSQGKSPATNIEMARDYFNDKVDIYVDGGEVQARPSKLISLLSSAPEVLRD